ncbi:MAG: GUN4 domain-containing protein, partial [Trichodesmium sp. St19_bin1]|nr:GUN4 domain-containing protein [Trichodesmium sp. St19_bin1]
AIFGGGIVYFGLRYFQTPQVSGQRQRELERQLRDEQRRVSSLQNQRSQAQQELERKLRDEQRRGQELEGRLSSLQNQKTQAQQELERQLEWERGKRQEVEAQLQRQGQVQPPVREPQSSGDVPLVSAVGVDYTKLRDLLVAKNWKEADLETDKKMLEVAGRESQGWLRVEDVENFPCQDLGTIDKLWVKYSGGKFGFSVQKQIYQDLGGTKDYDYKVWNSFGDKVGWRKGGEWLDYSNLTFSDGHYMGHLPGGVSHIGVRVDHLPGGREVVRTWSILVVEDGGKTSFKEGRGEGTTWGRLLRDLGWTGLDETVSPNDLMMSPNKVTFSFLAQRLVDCNI